MRSVWLVVLVVACDAGEPQPPARPHVAVDHGDELEVVPPVRSAPAFDGATWSRDQHFLGATDELVFTYIPETHRFGTFEIATGRARRGRAFKHAPAGEPTRVIATSTDFVFEWNNAAVFAHGTSSELVVTWTGPIGIEPRVTIDDLVIGVGKDRVVALALADGAVRWERAAVAPVQVAADATTLVITRGTGQYNLDLAVDVVDPRTGETRSSETVEYHGPFSADIGTQGIAFNTYGGACVIDKASHREWVIGGVIDPFAAPFVIDADAYFVRRNFDKVNEAVTVFATTLAGKRTWTTTVGLHRGNDKSERVLATPELVLVPAGAKVIALDRATGVPRWQHTFSIEPRGMTLGRDTLVAYDDDKIVGISTEALR